MRALLLFLFVSGAFAADASLAAPDLSLSVDAELAPVGEEQGPPDYHRLMVSIVLTNIGKRPLRIPTQDLGSYGSGTDRTIFMFTAGLGLAQGRVIVPSEFRFFPVTLQPGESASLPFTDTRIANSAAGRFSEVTVIYTVEEALAKRYGWWSGSLSQSVSTSKEPNQPPQRNAGSRPSSDDSSSYAGPTDDRPASETPSSLCPRG